MAEITKRRARRAAKRIERQRRTAIAARSPLKKRGRASLTCRRAGPTILTVAPEYGSLDGPSRINPQVRSKSNL